jgi:hypothetical protein
MRAATVTAAGFVAAILCSAVQAAPPQLPATVAADLKAVAALCAEVGGKALTDDAVKRADLNGDGRHDFVLFVGWVNCDGAASIFGDREKSVTVYVGDASGGARNAFSDSVYHATLEGAGPSAKLWLGVSGQQCGKKPAADFASENFCDRPIAWNGKTGKFDWAPVSSVRMIQ